MTRRISTVLIFASALLPQIVSAQSPPPATAVRSAAPSKTDPNAPSNAGRLQLTQYLDAIALKSTDARHASVAALKTKAEAQSRQAKVRKQLLSLIGPLPVKTPLNAKVLGTTQAEGFRIEKILFDSQPNFHVTALLYLPDGTGTAKLPAILMAPGHGPSGKAGDLAFAAAFARNGFALLSYDPIGQGERLQYPDPANPDQSLATRPTGEHGEAGLQPVLIGETITKYFLWDAMRAIDYLTTRPEIDPARIGAFGCSGGGLMTALITALDSRVAAAGTACFITSFDTLLPSIGPQDGEQSIPGFISAGLDFPDWVELATPRPYAIISTTSDMFPFAGAQKSEAESRAFYKLFQADQNLAFITGPGGHGNIRPLAPQILGFFLKHLQPKADADQPNLASLTTTLPKGALQVTPSGQVATSYPDSATVQSLNEKQAAVRIANIPIQKIKHPTLVQTQQAVREITRSSAPPGAPSPSSEPVGSPDPDHIRHALRIAAEPGITLQAEFYRPTTPGKHPTLLILRDNLDPSLDSQRADDIAHLRELARSGTAVFVLAPRPSPPGSEELKSPVLGAYYLLGLRAELVGKTLLGMRVDDVIRSIDFFSTGYTEDPNNITAEASGHLGLVLLHAAVLDPRLKHITVDHSLASYDSLIKALLPRNAPEDILPGVALRYDTGDLIHALGSRVTFTDPAPGDQYLSRSTLQK
ncbi:MAG: Acetyl xylan esterase [Acidobacteriaceae bacterium]|nr:Acetyl xylan esterase [Acidobacteriaceae bacterium]